MVARAALWANAGILTGNTFYFALSALGVGALLVASHDVFVVIKLLGAAYWCGWAFERFAARARPTRGAGHDVDRPRWTNARSGFRAPDGEREGAPVLRRAAAAIHRHTAGDDATGVLAVTSVVIEFLILAGYGYGMAAQRAAREARFVTATNRVSGARIATRTAIVARDRRRAPLHQLSPHLSRPSRPDFSGSITRISVAAGALRRSNCEGTPATIRTHVAIDLASVQLDVWRHYTSRCRPSGSVPLLVW